MSINNKILLFFGVVPETILSTFDTVFSVRSLLSRSLDVILVGIFLVDLELISAVFLLLGSLF
jgi:hypothetical protein